MTNYPYSSENLIENPQKYQMSPFEGKDFLSSYLNSRKKIIQILEKNKKNSYDEILDQFKKFTDVNFESFSETIILEKFLSFLICNLFEMNKDEKTNEYVDLLLKKFEIKKRLYSTYNSEFKEITNDYKNLHNYTLLTLIFQIKHKQTRALKYLNAILKLNDILCSQHSNLNSHDAELTYYLLRNEIDFVSELCHKKGIEL